jgi:hypothetical protein
VKGEPVEIRSTDGVITMTDEDPDTIRKVLLLGPGAVLTLHEVAFEGEPDPWNRTGRTVILPVAQVVRVTIPVN